MDRGERSSGAAVSRSGGGGGAAAAAGDRARVSGGVGEW